MKTTLFIFLSFCSLLNPIFAQTHEENVVLKQSKGVLDGTLLMPNSTKKVPVVLIVAGSGPTDRNGNSSLNVTAKSYQLLAEGLAKNGIASLRYDKRGVGKSASSMMKESDLTFETYIQDVQQWIDTLKKSNRFSKITVLGHSEGSLLSMVAVQKSPVDGYISLAGPARGIDEILNEQMAQQPLPDSVKNEVKRNLDKLKKGETLPKLMQNMAIIMLFRPSIQPYMISWLKYVPAEEIKKVKAKTLIIQGTTDIQVSENEGKLLAAAQPKAKLLLINGMNHVLKDAPADRAENIETYTNPDLPLSKGMIEAVVKFVDRL
ncbi:alpha/beta hydrolase [Arcicella rosea]|uniref:Pimeloyl-ACP methyl ester carboxylesterase n=1 Tax=Arcicella rosea TaxID=502909 RepID=A0A841ESR7_9BACT|nr:alpha/beta fold hydrolase [Arcicella rosea]MBB6003310.1 pimeloyl-ACP methyl ester carboxylesterase [Arcicella rosea]